MARNWLDKIRTRLRPEEAVALLFLLPFVLIAVARGFSPKWDPRIVLVFLTPALIVGSAAAIAQGSGRKLWLAVRDFLPFLMAVWVYENLHLATAFIHLRDKHDWLIAADEWLFRGVNPLVWLQRFVNTDLTNLMVIAYTGHFFYSPILAMVLYWRGQLEDFHDTMLALVITLFVGYLGYVSVPAIFPGITMQERFSVNLRGSRIAEQALDLYTISALRIPRDSFPSLHTAVTLVTLAFAYRAWRPYFWILLPCGMGLIFSTVYLRLHYVVDILAAAPLAMFSIWAAPRVNRWWYRGPSVTTAGDCLEPARPKESGNGASR